MRPQDGGQRPWLVLAPEEAAHPLAIEQSEGITFDRLMDLYALAGHSAPGLKPGRA